METKNYHIFDESKSNQSIIFDSYSITIRQMPENYLIANYHDFSWQMDPDLAANKSIVLLLSLYLLEHSFKYSKQNSIELALLIKLVNDNFKTLKISFE